MKPDREILEVEQRLVRRRRELDYLAHEAVRQTVKKIASPLALAGVAALGFIAGGGVRRRHREKEGGASKKTGIAGLLMTGVMWFVRARFGGPVGLAQFVLSKVKKGNPSSPASSPFGDSGEAEGGGRRHHSRPAQIYR